MPSDHRASKTCRNRIPGGAVDELSTAVIYRLA
jgi:hypothetical protein